VSLSKTGKCSYWTSWIPLWRCCFVWATAVSDCLFFYLYWCWFPSLPLVTG